MKLSDYIMLLVAKLAEGGDVNVFTGDMIALTSEDINLCDTMAEDPTEIKRYGERYLFIGER